MFIAVDYGSFLYAVPTFLLSFPFPYFFTSNSKNSQPAKIVCFINDISVYLFFPLYHNNSERRGR